MSVRAIAIRSGPRPALRSRPLLPSRPTPRPSVGGGASLRPGTRTSVSLWAAFADDRRFIGVKLILMGVLFLAILALEVPW